MKKFYYLFICIPFLALLFPNSVKAAQSSHTISGTDNDGRTLNIRYQDHDSVDPSDYYEETINNNTFYGYTWDLSENIDLVLTQGYYYSGYVNVKLSWASNISGVSLSSVSVTNTNTTDGIYVYASTVSSNYIQLQFVFDNYMTSSASTLGTATLNLKFTYRGATTTPYLNVTFTPTKSNNLHGYDVVQNNALTSMIWSAINQGVGPQFDTVMSLLTDIRNQDYTYYVQLTNGISQIITNQTNSYQALLDIIDELDEDFDDVQTILDLFPSYRTQVLAYWQQLLEMNAEQQSKSAEIESQAQNKENQSNQLLSGLDSIQLPSVSAGDLDIFSGTDNTVKTNFFGLIGIITHQSLITKLFLIVVVAGITGYAIYGKRG